MPIVTLDAEQLRTIAQAIPGGRENIEDLYPLTPLQEGLLFHHRLSEKDAYILSTLLELPSMESVGAFVNALQRVVRRHEALRSAVFWETLPRPVQVVCKEVALTAERLALDPARPMLDQLRARMRPHQDKWNLQQAPLLRVAIAAAETEGRWYVLLQVHHLLCDHQSLRNLISEAGAFLAGRERELSLSAPFGRYVAETLETCRMAAAESFFRARLGDVVQTTAPFGVTLDTWGRQREIVEESRLIQDDLARQIRSQAKLLGVSPARLIHAAWALVVAVTSGRADVVYGTVLLAAQQKSRQGARMLGMAVNTLPLRFRLDGLSVLELVRYTSSELAALMGHQDVPLTVAQRCAGGRGRRPLFTTLLNCRRNGSELQGNAEASSAARVLAQGEAWTGYPITMIVDDSGETFMCTAQTDPGLEPGRVAGYLHTALRSLVEALATAPETASLALPILSDREELVRGVRTSG